MNATKQTNLIMSLLFRCSVPWLLIFKFWHGIFDETDRRGMLHQINDTLEEFQDYLEGVILVENWSKLTMKDVLGTHLI